MTIWMYSETDGDAGHYGIKLFLVKERAEEYKKNVASAYGELHEMEVETRGVAPVESVKCPECGSEMKSRKGLYGPFWGCKTYPKCKGTRDSMGRSKEDRLNERKAENNRVLGSERLDDANFRFRKHGE